MNRFREDWQHFYGDCAPLGFALRDTSKPWLRLHSLPESKRYAETRHERATLLRRASAVAITVLGNDPVWLVQLGDLELGWPSDALRPRIEFALQAAGEYHHDEVAWPAFAALTQFTLGAFGTLIEDIANEHAFRTLWMSNINGRVFAPYDGGMDVFMESDSEIANLKAQFSDWLPADGDL